MLGASFNRIQFTPDTTPTELVGEYVEKFGERVYEPGVVYTNVLLADEINRTPPRTQSALLEAMQERQVTVEGRSHKLKDPFLVIATQNANEFEGVYRLPESQLDRFLFKVELEYADEKAELGMLDLPHDGLMPDMIADIHPMLGVVGLEKARYELNATVLPTEVARYIVAVGRRTREIPGVQLGASSRSLIHLASASKAIARLAGRDTVSVEDVREIAPYVLRHRLIVDPRVDPNDVLDEALESAPLPERELTSLCSSVRGPQPADASFNARRPSTSARCLRNSLVAAWSDGGFRSFEMSAAASSIDAPPAIASSAARARTGVAPMFVSAIAAFEIDPLSRSATTATPTVAQSWARRAIFTYDQLRVRAELRHPDLDEHLAFRQRGREDARAEVDGGNRPLAARAAHDHLRVEREEDGGEIGGRIAVGDRPSDRPAVSHLRIADLARGEGHDRAVLLEQRSVADVLVPRDGADRDVVAAVPHVAQLVHARDVDEERGPGDAELHRGEQRVPAGEQLRVLVLAEQRDRVLRALGDLVVELRGNHDLASSIARHTLSGVAGSWTSVTPRCDERVDDGVDDRRCGRDRAGLPHPLHAERVVGLRLGAIGLVGRELGRRRHEVRRHRRRRAGSPSSSYVPSSNSAAAMPCVMPPCTCPSMIIGLTGAPTSSTAT